MGTEDRFIAAVAQALAEHGQAATQFITAALDGDGLGRPDIVFSPDDPGDQVICVEVKGAAAPTLSSIVLNDVLRHRRAVIEANPGILYVLATNAALNARLGGLAAREGLIVLPLSWDNPQALALAIKALSIRGTP